jgi:hypothetical protein
LIRRVKNEEDKKMINTIFSSSRLCNFLIQDLLDNQLVE